MGIIKDLTGQVFGRLTVIEFAGLKNNRNSKWLCKCECGNEVTVFRLYLTNGSTKSCGCYKSDLNKTRHKKNEFEVDGDITRLFISDLEGNVLICLIDTNDLPKVSDKKWFTKYSKSSKNYYATTVLMTKGIRKVLFMHRVITNAPKGMVVDHKNHQTLDNRKENLRVCTSSENSQNRKGLDPKNTSGVRNVYYINKLNKFKVQMKVNGKTHYFGLYSDFQEAKRIADENRKKFLPFAQ